MSTESPITSKLEKPKKKFSTFPYILVVIALVLIGFIVAFILLVCGNDPPKHRQKSEAQKISGQKWPTLNDAEQKTNLLQTMESSNLGNAADQIPSNRNFSTARQGSTKRFGTTYRTPTTGSGTHPAAELNSSNSTKDISTKTSFKKPVNHTSNDESLLWKLMNPSLNADIMSRLPLSATSTNSKFASDIDSPTFEVKVSNPKVTVKYNDSADLTPSVNPEVVILPQEVTQKSLSIETSSVTFFEKNLPEETKYRKFDAVVVELPLNYGDEATTMDKVLKYQTTTSPPIFTPSLTFTSSATTEKAVHETTVTVPFVTAEEILPYFEFKKTMQNNTVVEPLKKINSGSLADVRINLSDEVSDSSYDFELPTDDETETPNQVDTPKDLPYESAVDAIPPKDESGEILHRVWKFPLPETFTQLPIVELTKASKITPSSTTTTISKATIRTTTTTAATTLNPILNIDNEIPICVKKKTQDCFPGTFNNQQRESYFPSESAATKNNHFGGLRPRHYNLNLTVHRGVHTTIEGTVEIMLDVIQETSTVFVNIGRGISNINLSQLQISSCSTGRIFCVASMVQHLREELLVIQLVATLKKGEIINLKISGINNPRVNDGVVVQNPHHWESNRPWTVATFFQLRKARAIFPCIDHPTFKASLNLCIKHPIGTNASSNTQIAFQHNAAGLTVTCFKRTPKMSTYLYAFAVHDRMQSIYKPKNSLALLPEIEVIYSEQMGKEKPYWIITETIQALKFMANYTGYVYPLNKLTLFASPLPVQGMENFGLILLNEQWVAYSMYPIAHTILAHEIVHQWIGNIVTVNSWDELCLQEALGTYIGYEITENLPESGEKLRELQEKRLQGIERDSRSRMPIVGDFQTYEDAFRCFDKPVLFFEMLSDGFGSEVVNEFTRSLMREHAFKNADFDVWERLLNKVAGTDQAGKFLKDFFTRPGIPVIQVENSENQLKLTQTVAIESRKTTEAPFALPLTAMQSSSKKRFKLFLNETIQTFIFNHTELTILDPDSKAYAIIIYQAEVYARLLRCVQTKSCRYIDEDGMERLLKDFCWAFLNDYLPITNTGPNAIKLWKDLTKQISSTSLVQGTCACCMDKKIQKSGEVYCKWHWKDRCENIQLAKELQKIM